MVGGRAGEGDQREEAEGERRKGGDGAFCTFTVTGELFCLPCLYRDVTGTSRVETTNWFILVKWFPVLSSITIPYLTAPAFRVMCTKGETPPSLRS